MRKLLLLVALSLFPTFLQGQAMTHAKGSFDVNVAPTGHNPDASITSMSIDKNIHGDLEATTKGEMLSAGDPKAGTAGYVAMERVTGKLNGRVGSFALMHFATMSGGKQEMKIIVVPGSGTNDLSGIYGTFTITIDASGKHTYDFEYAFATK
ncbi:DUF3224 domain-containing protein [Terriglobus tenax]|uniref:DUF3224 domain-containing protein n=1 Tax=Terriglobus tenax TaxID=1111115 RepID=UPI0021DFC1A4|nr:DUF3224 domain-containing protein [Terriglobus tenax]